MIKPPKTTDFDGLVASFADLFRPSALSLPSALKTLLQEAARHAGWRPPSPRAERRQKVASQKRQEQRQEDQALRRSLVAHTFKKLPARLRQKPQSDGTAQAIIGRLDQLQGRRPPMTVRTVKADIKFWLDNGNM